MTLAAMIGFLLVSFMFTAIIIKLAAVIWNAMVKNQDRYYYEREFWDKDGELEEITADTLEGMRSRITAIEIIPAEARNEA